VGQNAREEINFEPSLRSGRNYGWRLREGRQPFDERTAAAFLPLTEPIHDYGRAVGASITGGFVYRGAALDPGYDGRYFYADFISGRVFSIGLHITAEGEATADDEREHTAQLGGRDVLGMVSSFAEDHDGELLVLNYSAGTVVRMVPDFTVVPPAPLTLAMSSLLGRAFLNWSMPATSVEAADFVVERLADGRVIERIVVGRPEASLDVEAGNCLRVRARGRSGLAGPPTTPVCISAP
jgi:hypothetical protein